MTITLDLVPETERRLKEELKEEASRRGVGEAEYARKLIEESLAPAGPPVKLADQATLDLLEKWKLEDATEDAGELARRQAEWEEFRNSMNENSLSSRQVYP